MEKSRHAWAKWKPGATVKYAVTSKAGERTQETTVSLTLESVSDAAVVVKSTFGTGEKAQQVSESTEISEKAGTETLTIDGKTYECTIWRSTSTRGGFKSENRAWLAKGIDVPIKAVNVTDRGEETVMTAASIRDEITAGGRTFECVRLEGVSKRRGVENKATLWLSSKVPSGNVKMTMETAGGTMTMELVEFADGQ